MQVKGRPSCVSLLIKTCHIELHIPTSPRFFWSPLALSTSWPNPQCSKLLKCESIRLLCILPTFALPCLQPKGAVCLHHSTTQPLRTAILTLQWQQPALHSGRAIRYSAVDMEHSFLCKLFTAECCLFVCTLSHLRLYCLAHSDQLFGSFCAIHTACAFHKSLALSYFDA